MTETEFLPCPFCGGPAVLCKPFAGRPYVACENNFCSGPKETEADAIAAWNRRTPDAIPREQHLAAIGAVLAEAAGVVHQLLLEREKDIKRRHADFTRGAKDALRDARAAIRAINPDALAALDQAVRRGREVKPIEWRQDGIYTLRAFGYVIETFRGPWPARLYIDGAPIGKSYRSQDDAKAAAQRDYEERILSALEPLA